MATTEELLAQLDAAMAPPALEPMQSTLIGALAGTTPFQMPETQFQTAAPSPLEAKMYELQGLDDYERSIADLYGRGMIARDSALFGIPSKLAATGEALKAALFLQNPIRQFEETTLEQDALKEWVKARDRAEGKDIAFGVTGPEIGGALLSPVKRLYTPVEGAALTNLVKAGTTTGAAAGTEAFLNTPGDLTERADAGLMGAAFGAAAGTTFASLDEMAKAAAPMFENLGDSMRRAARGVRQADYQKTAGKGQTTIVDGASESLTKRQADSIIRKGLLGDTLDPAAMDAQATASYQRLNSEVSAAIQNVDSNGVVPKTPDFKKLRADIDAGKFGGENAPALTKKLDELEVLIDSRSGDKLDYIQNQKKYYGENYTPNASTYDSKFNNAIYHELKDTIERYAPDVKNLNKDIQGLILMRPVLRRGIAQDENVGNKIAGALRRVGYTTGGLFGAGSIPALTTVLGPAAPIAGLALGLTGAALDTPRGKEAAGRLLGGAGQSLAKAATNQISPALIASLLGRGPTDAELGLVAPPGIPEATQEQPIVVDDLLAELEAAMGTDAPQVEERQVEAQPISALIKSKPPLIQAIVMTESSGNPQAQSEVGARGLMQLMPKTAKELGVEDPFDPVQNLEGGTKYINQLLKRYDNNKMKALAAYNWGMGNLDNAMREAGVKTWPALVRKLGERSKSNPGGIPKETINYVKKVMAAEQRLMMEV